MHSNGYLSGQKTRDVAETPAFVSLPVAILQVKQILTNAVRSTCRVRMEGTLLRMQRLK